MTDLVSDDPSPSDTVEAPPLPGAQLRAAREARGLSLSDIAHALKFSERQVMALENDRYEQLPAGPFVRGFVRGYARLMKLDASPLLLQLEQVAPSPGVEVSVPQNMGDAAPRSPVINLARVGMVVMAALLLAGVGYVMRETPFGLDAQVRTESLPVASHDPPQPQAASASAVVAPAMGRKLVFDFDDKSWIEIRDAGNAILLTGEFPRGSHQEVAGNGPFQVWIGNAPVVRASIEGRVIDLQPATREGVARLTVE